MTRSAAMRLQRDLELGCPTEHLRGEKHVLAAPARRLAARLRAQELLTRGVEPIKADS